jgi:hypothetical protein
MHPALLRILVSHLLIWNRLTLKLLRQNCKYSRSRSWLHLEVHHARNRTQTGAIKSSRFQEMAQSLTRCLAHYLSSGPNCRRKKNIYGRDDHFWLQAEPNSEIAVSAYPAIAEVLSSAEVRPFLTQNGHWWSKHANQLDPENFDTSGRKNEAL